MTQLLLIAIKTYSESVNNIGDIVGYFPDSWVFSPKEIEFFDIVKVAESKEDIQSKIPIIKSLTKAATTEWTDQEPEGKAVWQGEDKQYRDIVTNPKYKLCLDKGVIKETYSKTLDNTATITTLSTLGSK